jgi:hypothetical protein
MDRREQGGEKAFALSHVSNSDSTVCATKKVDNTHAFNINENVFAMLLNTGRLRCICISTGVLTSYVGLITLVRGD